MPKIEEFGTGKIIIGGKTYVRDVLVLSDGTVKRREEIYLDFVNHIIKKAEITEILKGYPEAIVIGTGLQEKVKISFEIASYVADKKAELIALPTPQAVTKYNQLIDNNKKIAALFHISD